MIGLEVWLKERVLQRYILENKDKFRPFGKKIIDVIDNKDRYPDLYCVLEDIGRVPAEVEWASSNFREHGHPINLLSNNHGVLFVCDIDEDLGYDVLQIKIDFNDFEEWFVRNSRKIIQDTIEPYRKSEKRKIPKLWFTYLSLKQGGVADFEPALRNHTWGIQKNYHHLVISILQESRIAFYQNLD